MSRIAILLADGFETIEALAPADVLRRGGQDVSLVSINLVTASGPAFAVDFGLELLRKLAGDEVAQRVADGMLETDKAE